MNAQSEDAAPASRGEDRDLLEVRRAELLEARAADRGLYSNSSGKPILRHSYVAYIDVLGTKEAIKRLNNEELQRLLDERDQFLIRLHNPERSRHGRMVSFTDNVVYGEPTRSEERGELLSLGMAIAGYQRALTTRGRLLRGGLVTGSLYIDSTFATGEGLTHAIDLEENRAIHPRVLLSRNAARRIDQESGAMGPAAASPHNQYFVVDEDGETFVNYLASGPGDYSDWTGNVRISHLSLIPHLTMLEEQLSTHDEPGRVRDKFLWAAQFHNWLCEETGQSKWKVHHGLSRWEELNPRRFQWSFGKPPAYET